MKLKFTNSLRPEDLVAPYAGAWIEIIYRQYVKDIGDVAPYAGAWIEINFFKSCGLIQYVAPYAGAWIEMFVLKNE